MLNGSKHSRHVLDAEKFAALVAGQAVKLDGFVVIGKGDNGQTFGAVELVLDDIGFEAMRDAIDAAAAARGVCSECGNKLAKPPAYAGAHHLGAFCYGCGLQFPPPPGTPPAKFWWDENQGDT